jgi:HSP20 family protein
MLPRSFTRFEDEFENMVARFFGNREEPSGNGGHFFAPKVNVAETENQYEISVDLPGMKPEDFTVEVREGNLWISGEKKEEKEEKGKTFHRVERHYGEFRRVIPLLSGVKEGEINAEYRDGVLAITLPKAEEVKPKKIEVKTT